MWLILAVVLAFGELAIFTGFILGPLSLAAVATAIAAALGASTELQLVIFGVGGIAAILIMRPIAKKHMNAPPELRTNASALIGMEARVLNEITHDQSGLIRLQNENWTATAVPGVGHIAPETYVTVVEITGATAIVKPKELEESENSQGASQ